MNTKTKRLLVILLTIVAFAAGCASQVGTKKNIIDSSKTKPDWLKNDTKLTWKDSDGTYFLAKRTMRGDERLDACYAMAGADAREILIRGVHEELRGEMDEAQISPNEHAELVLGKVRSGKWDGRLSGFQESEHYYEIIEYCDQKSCEKMKDCWVLGYISNQDYAKTRDAILNKLIAIDPKIKKAIIDKESRFFGEEEKPAAEESEQVKKEGKKTPEEEAVPGSEENQN